MRVKIYVHKTCPTSLKLLELLEKENLLNKIELIDVAQEPFKSLNKGIISVPAIEINGEIIDMGPIDFPYVLEIIKNEVHPEIKISDFDKVARKLMSLITDNVFYSINVFLRDKLNFLLDSDSILEYLGVKDKRDEFIKWLESREKDLLMEFLDAIKRTIVRNFLFEVKLVIGKRITLDEFKSLYRIENLAHWLISRGSTARISLVYMEDVKILKKAKEIYTEILHKLQHLS